MERCPICCGERRERPFYEAPDWRVVRCGQCTFAWVQDLSPRPATTSFDWDEEVFLESRRRSRLYVDRIARIEAFHPHPRTWLDVGCGGGGLLRCAARSGYTVEGIELSASGRRVAQDLSVMVHDEPLAQCATNLQAGVYGVISYFHVLEHVIDPLDEVRTAANRLAPDGVLAVEVPHFDTLPWKIRRHRHRHFYRGHRSYFNTRSLNTLMGRAALDVMAVHRGVPHYVSLAWLSAKLRLPSLLRRGLHSTNLIDRTVRADFGDMLLMVARRARRAASDAI